MIHVLFNKNKGKLAKLIKLSEKPYVKFLSVVRYLLNLGTDNPALTDHDRRIIYIVNLIGCLTVLLNFIPGVLLFYLTKHYMIFIPSTLEGFLFMAVPYLNSRRKYNSAVWLMFSTHCASALYFGLLFGPAINVSAIAFFLVGSVVVLFRTNLNRILCIILSLMVVTVLELDYSFNLVKPLLLNSYNTEVVKRLAEFIVTGLDILVLFFYISALWKQNERQEKLVEQRTLQLKIAVDSMEDYVRKLSHDIRLKLTGMVNTNVDLAFRIEDAGFPDRLEIPTSILKGFDSSTMELYHMVNNVLDLSRIKAGQMDEPNFQAIRIEELFDKCVDFHRLQAIRKGVNIEFSIAENVPPRLVTDIPRMGRILDNLISNAVKFTKENTVIKVSVDINSKNNTIEFAVTDRGSGIADDQLEAIFNIFTTTDNSFTGGMGIGLTNARELAKSLNGDLHVNSRLGIGSTFTIVHPITSLSKVKEEKTIPINEREYFPDSTVLIIDDDSMSHKGYELVLKRLGMEVRFEQYAENALASAKQFPTPDIIILDRHLPKIDGLTILKELKKDRVTKNIPVFMASADSDVLSKEESLKAGASAYLLKPVFFDVLYMELRRILSTQVIK